MDLVHIRGALAKGADVAKWIKAMDCGSITRGFNPRRSPIRVIQYHRGMIGAPPTSRHPISEAIAPGLPEVQVLFAGNLWDEMVTGNLWVTISSQRLPVTISSV